MEMNDIHRALASRFSNHKYKLYNSYVFNWESDFFSTTSDNRYIYEVEVKLSRSDFFADFKKGEKHTSLTTAMGLKLFNEIHTQTPNRFYYCCPEGMIKKEELPPYAGLIYLNENGTSARQVKTAPMIHKNNNVDKYLRSLIDKFYFQHEKMRSDYTWAKYQLKNHDFVVKENTRLRTIVNLERDNGFMLEIEQLKKDIKKLKDDNFKLLVEKGTYFRELEDLKRTLITKDGNN